jgi:hypothetical protein
MRKEQKPVVIDISTTPEQTAKIFGISKKRSKYIDGLVDKVLRCLE